MVYVYFQLEHFLVKKSRLDMNFISNDLHFERAEGNILPKSLLVVLRNSWQPSPQY